MCPLYVHGNNIELLNIILLSFPDSINTIITSVCSHVCVHVCSHMVSHVVSYVVSRVRDHHQEGCRGLPCVRRRTSGRPKAVLVKSMQSLNACALTKYHIHVRTRFLRNFCSWSFGFTYRKGVRIERNFSPKRLLFFTHSAQIIFHSVINSTHLNSPTNSCQSRKNRVVQSFRKRFHPIIRSNNHR